MQHFGRVRSVSCHTSCESVVHCLSAPLSESSHQAYTSSHAVNDRTSFSSAKVVSLRESPLSLANNTKIWAPRQCQRRAICPQHPNIERRRCWHCAKWATKPTHFDLTGARPANRSSSGFGHLHRNLSHTKSMAFSKWLSFAFGNRYFLMWTYFAFDGFCFVLPLSFEKKKKKKELNIGRSGN